MSLLALSTATLWFALAPQAPAAPPTQSRPVAAPPVMQDTPEAAFKAFYIAVVTGDEATLRKVTLPAEGFEWLLKGEHVPADKVDDFRREVIDKMVLKRLNVGDEVKLPGGRSFKIGEGQVGPDKVILQPENSPIPADVERVLGVWKVDARPIIAGRRASDAARRKAAAAKKAG